MSDNERPRDPHRDRDTRREPRGGRARDNERSNTSNEGRNRSRSPRQDRGGRRDDGRYRSRSPIRRDERDGDRGRSDRGRGDRNDRGRGDRSDRGRGDRNDRGPGDRGPPSGPRSGAVPRSAPSSAPRATPKVIKPDPFDDEEAKDVVMKEEQAQPEDMDDDTWAMKQVMGFVGFKSTKNTKVPGNNKNYGVRKDKQMEARQYMNRQGGFNRPLSPGRG